MMILYFYHNLSYICYWLSHDNELRDILPLIAFSTTDGILISVNNSNFTPVVFKAACHSKRAKRNFAGSNS